MASHVWPLITISAIVLAGCSTMGVGKSEFGCTKDQTGIPCSSVAEVYDRTNAANYASAINASRSGEKQVVPVAGRPASVMPIGSPDWPTPVLEPAQVMRVWIAPWVDDKQSLHWPSFVFTEVTPRKWSFGGADFRKAKTLAPVQIDHRKDPQSSESSSTATQDSH